MPRLIKEKEGKLYGKDVNLTDNPESLKPLLSKASWSILKRIAQKPTYPAQIARELSMQDQKVYYHIKQLRKANFIEVERKEEQGGSLAKYYRVKDHAFALELPFGDEKLLELPVENKSEKLTRFLKPLVSNGQINCKIVVGSPDAHGPHQVRGRDGHYAVDLALVLGQYGSLSSGFMTKLDVDVKAENDFADNMILVGGPLTNTLTSEFNNHLPVRFKSEEFPYRELTSDRTGQSYHEDNVGLIAKVPNPRDPEKFVIILAGVRYSGTGAAILALSDFKDKVFSDYEGEDTWARVVLGKDMNGDGKTDDIEILE